MSASTSRRAYDDCYSLMNQALENPKGLRCLKIDYSEACQLVVRLNYARNLQRELNTKVFGDDDPKAGVSNYDTLIIRKKEIDDEWWVYIEPRQLDGNKVELL